MLVLLCSKVSFLCLLPIWYIIVGDHVYVVSVLKLLLVVPKTGCTRNAHPVMGGSAMEDDCVCFSFGRSRVSPSCLSGDRAVTALSTLLTSSLRATRPSSLVVASLVIPRNDLGFGT